MVSRSCLEEGKCEERGGDLHYLLFDKIIKTAFYADMIPLFFPFITDDVQGKVNRTVARRSLMTKKCE